MFGRGRSTMINKIAKKRKRQKRKKKRKEKKRDAPTRERTLGIKTKLNIRLVTLIPYYN